MEDDLSQLRETPRLANNKAGEQAIHLFHGYRPVELDSLNGRWQDRSQMWASLLLFVDIQVRVRSTVLVLGP